MDVRNAVFWLGQHKVQLQQYVLHHCTFVHSETLWKPACPTLVKLKLPTDGYELFLIRSGSHVFQAICDQHHLLGACMTIFSNFQPLFQVSVAPGCQRTRVKEL